MLGSVEQHLVFALLQLGTLGWNLHRSRHAAKLLRGLLCASTAATVLYHASLGVAPASAWASAMAQRRFEGKLLQITIFPLFSSAQMASCVASFFVAEKAEGVDRVAKLAILNGLALINGVAACRWCQNVHSDDTFRAIRLSTVLLALLSLIFIYAITKSSVIKFVLLVCAALMILIQVYKSMACARARACACVCTCTCTCVHVCVRGRVGASACVHLSTHLRAHVHVCIHT